ncbi:flavin reductase family protein [Aeromicrobium sp.]|uniref:flavin reductase family protein n=1 Tax=Aeromicrobium sp. TaxID=1871063 RepID=UPI0030BBCDBF
MTIHSDHPFVPAEGDRDQLRRMRGRMAAPVTVWAAGSGAGRRGLTVSSVLLAEGDPGRVLGLVDVDSEFWESAPTTWTINLLGPEHRFLADAFAGNAPAPGGLFTLGDWSESEWGPVLAGTAGWIGVRLVEAEPRSVGWGLLVEGVVESVTVGAETALVHLRGRYLDPTRED